MVASASHLAPAVTGIPTFNVTSYGVHAHIPVVEIDGLSIAILFSSQGERPLGLLLGPCDRAADPTRPLYHPCIFDGALPWRLIYLSAVGALDPSAITWRSIYLTHIPLARPTTHLLMNRGRTTPFRIPQRLLDELKRAGFKVSLPKNMRFPWRGNPPAKLTIFNRHWLGFHDIEIHFGRCTAASSRRPNPPPMLSLETTPGEPHTQTLLEPQVLNDNGPRWARISVASQASSNASGSGVSHDCTTDHVDDWADGRRSFTPFDAAEWAVAVEITLVLTPCPLNPVATYVVDFAFKRWHRATGRVLYQSYSS